MIRFHLKYEGPVPKHARRHMRQILRRAYEAVGVYWHQHFREKHFTRAGAREYQYTPRSGETGSGRWFRQSYTGRKLREKGHTNPLVWTGESRNVSRLRDVRATSKSVRVVMRTPRLNWRPKGSTRSMRDELTRISPREEQVLRDIFAREIARGLQELKDTSRVSL